jgi:hypothetical protein
MATGHALECVVLLHSSLITVPQARSKFACIPGPFFIVKMHAYIQLRSSLTNGLGVRHQASICMLCPVVSPYVGRLSVYWFVFSTFLSSSWAFIRPVVHFLLYLILVIIRTEN